MQKITPFLEENTVDRSREGTGYAAASPISTSKTFLSDPPERDRGALFERDPGLDQPLFHRLSPDVHGQDFHHRNFPSRLMWREPERYAGSRPPRSPREHDAGNRPSLALLPSSAKKVVQDK